jgi:catechol 2,3-dioxygenase-like lactoylglutathione lyase family enzyme
VTEERQVVTGIGGVFIHAADPAALARWYERHLGITTESYGGTFYRVFPWRRDAAPDVRATTTWAIFPAEGALPTPRSGVVNYHVEDMDRTVAQLQADGITIESRLDESYGRFAWIHDPEGNKIELYQELETQG